MSGTTYQRSDNINFPSGYDFTNSGANSQPTYQIVKFGSSSTAGQIVPAAASTDQIIGVIVNLPTSTNSPYSGVTGSSPTTAEVHAINAQGTCKVQAGGSFSAGAYLTSNSSGKAVSATQTSGGSQPSVVVFGVALQASTGSGQIVEYLPMNILY